MPSEGARTQARQKLLLTLWKHECNRVFADRLVDHKDKNWFNETINRLLEDTFGGEAEGLKGTAYFVDFQREAPLDPDDAQRLVRLYEELFLAGDRQALWQFYAFENNLIEWTDWSAVTTRPVAFFDPTIENGIWGRYGSGAMTLEIDRSTILDAPNWLVRNHIHHSGPSVGLAITSDNVHTRLNRVSHQYARRRPSACPYMHVHRCPS